MAELIAKAVKYVPAWVPGAGFQKKAAAWKRAVLSMRDLPFETVQKALVSWTVDVNTILQQLIMDPRRMGLLRPVSYLIL